MSVVRPTSPAVLQPTRSPVVTPAGLPWGTRVPGGVAAWTPAQLADLEAWYRADDVVTSGSSITTWTDKAGNHNLTQGTGTAQPTLTTRAGQSVASFDGGDYVQGTFGHTHVQPNTIYAVFEMTAIGTTTIVFDGDDATNRHQGYAVASGPQWRMFAGTAIGAGTPATATIYGASYHFNGAASKAWFNDFRAAQEVISGNAGADALDGFTIGANNVGAGGLVGYIWEVIVCTTAHDAATRKLVGDYLTARYDSLVVTT